MPKAIREIIPQVLQQATAKHQALSSVRDAWPRLVGKLLAKHTRPISLRKAVLYVQTDEPGASFLLALQRGRLLARLREATGQGIDEIVVRPGEPSE